MTERIISLLKENSLVSDYRLNTVKTESYEMFFVHRDLETVRSTDTADRKVTVFVECDGKLGDATFSVYASYTDDDIRREIASACKKASLAANEPYALPENEQIDKHHPMVVAIKEWVDQEYLDGRQTVISDDEMEAKITELSGGKYQMI